MLWLNLTANLYSYLSLCEGLFWTLYLKWWNSHCADNDLFKDPHSNTPALSDSIECRINITKNKTSNATPKHSQGNDASEHKISKLSLPQDLPPLPSCYWKCMWLRRSSLLLTNLWVFERLNMTFVGVYRQTLHIRTIQQIANLWGKLHKHLFTHMHKHGTSFLSLYWKSQATGKGLAFHLTPMTNDKRIPSS